MPAGGREQASAERIRPEVMRVSSSPCGRRAPPEPIGGRRGSPAAGYPEYLVEHEEETGPPADADPRAVVHVDYARCAMATYALCWMCDDCASESRPACAPHPEVEGEFRLVGVRLLHDPHCPVVRGLVSPDAARRRALELSGVDPEGFVFPVEGVRPAS